MVMCQPIVNLTVASKPIGSSPSNFLNQPDKVVMYREFFSCSPVASEEN
jgi:hypothetical protein